MTTTTTTTQPPPSLPSFICSNCGIGGHYFRACKEPITSLGILAFKQELMKPTKWLLIRRRISIGFIELLRGKFEIRDEEGIRILIDQTTLYEKALLQTQSFNDLWIYLWNGPATKRYQMDFEQSKVKFEILRSRGILANLCLKSATSWIDPEWGFPKGRRSVNETEINCALRETQEEAGIPSTDLILYDHIPPLCEEYIGSNGVTYRHKYWIAEVPSHIEVSLNPGNIEQQREVSDVRWCTMEEALSLIRPYAKEKIEVLRQANTIIK
jgi:8-oxo-dGTP pyrophosphatase MutT (NUDIX family)